MQEIEQIKVAALKPYERNSRTHSEAQVGQIVASIKEFGFTNPVLVDTDNRIIAGHGRWTAAQQMGLDEVPCLRLGDLTEAQIKAYVIADNKLAENAGWDVGMLQLEMEELKAAGYNLELLGFEDAELGTIFKFIDPNPGNTDPDEIPDPPEEPVSQPGDLWQLGPHRLLCGDSTLAQSAITLFAGGQADMIFTDPPYNVNYQGATKDKLTIKNDNLKPAQFYQFLFDSFKVAATVVNGGAPIYVCYSDSESLNFRKALEDNGWLVKSCLIWVKNHFKLGRMDYHMRHEPIMYGWMSGAAHKWHGGRKLSTVIDAGLPGLVITETDDGAELSFSDGLRSCILKVPSYELAMAPDDFLSTIWRVDKPAKNVDHPTTKPVEIPRRAIENSSKNGDTVYEPFMGSGSTLIACEMTGRVCYGLELDPRYCDVIVNRWEQFTGNTARRNP